MSNAKSMVVWKVSATDIFILNINKVYWIENGSYELYNISSLGSFPSKAVFAASGRVYYILNVKMYKKNSKNFDILLNLYIF